MLSYRHSFHAGNFADVIKHIVLVEILQHLCRKDAPFDYIDTHAGAGLFDLSSEHAGKLQEFRNGIARLATPPSPELWPELAAYFTVLNHYNSPGELQHYPGSPMIALHFLRARDREWLFELHPADFAILQGNVAGDRRIKVAQEDGFQGLLRLLPPLSRRALVLIDPAYEVKDDFLQVVKTCTRAWQKFPTGIYIVWYPVVDRERIDELESRFVNSGIRNIQRFELGLTADTAARGLTAAGVVVINPPWTLMGKMTTLLPRLLDALRKDEDGFFKADTLVPQ
jgi:23S rRNA (adenine2030-N6)-methyltransferase